MFSVSMTSTPRRNLFPAVQHLKPLATFWRSQKTQGAPLERNESYGDSAKTDVEGGGRVRPFEDIPGPKKNFRSIVEFYRKTKGLRRFYKMNQSLFAEHGPIFKNNILGQTMVHITDPDDFEKVFRAEGKFPRRPPVDIWVEHRKRRNYFPGIILL